MRAAGVALAVLLLASATLLLVGLLCLNTFRVRALLVKRVNTALSQTFAGRIELRDVGWIDPTGVSGASAALFDPEGRRVIDVHGLNVRLDAVRLALSLLSRRSDPLVVRIEHVALDHAELRLIDDGSGSPTLLGAFAPQTPPGPSAAPSSEPGRGLVLIVDEIELAHVWVHGRFGDLPPLDLELRGLEGALRENGLATWLQVRRSLVRARGLPRGLDPGGEISGRVRVAKRHSAPLELSALFRGELLRTPVRAELALHGSSIEATLHAPRIGPAELKALIPELSAKSPLGLRLEARGDLPEVSFDGAIEGPAAELGFFGTASFRAPISIEGRVIAERLDPAGLLAGAPRMRLAFVGQTSWTFGPGGKLHGSYRIDTEPSELGGVPIGAVGIRGAASVENGVTRSSGRVTLEEPGAPTRLDYTLVTSHGLELGFRTRTALERPRRLERAADLTVSGRLESEGRYLAATGQLEARVRARLEHVARPPVTASRVSVDARVSGKPAAPIIAGTIETGELNLAGRRFAGASLDVRGTPERFSARASLRGTVRERLELATDVVMDGRTIVLRHPVGRVMGERSNVELRAPAVRIGPRGVSADDLTLSGAGSARLSIDYREELERFELSTHELQLGVITELAAVHTPLEAGRATLEVSYTRAPAREGHLRGSIDGLSLGPIAHGKIWGDATLENERVSGSVWARVGESAVDLLLDQVGPLPPDLSMPKLDELYGRVELKGQLNLSELAPHIPESRLSVEKGLGMVLLDVDVARTPRGPALPDVSARIETRGLELTGPRARGAAIVTREQARRQSPWSVREIDVDAHARLEGANGAMTLGGSLFDRRGTLADFSLATTVAAELLETPRSWAHALWTRELRARLRVPERRLQGLPPLVRPQGALGRFRLDLELEGTLRDPRLRLSSALRGYRSSDAEGRPLDLSVRAEHARERGRLLANVQSSQKMVATLVARWQGAPEWLDGPGLHAGLFLRLDDFPLDSLPAALESRIGGSLSGSVRVDGLGDDARLDATLLAAPLLIGEARLDSARATLRAEHGELTAQTRLSHHLGFAEARIQSRYDWGARVFPSLSTPARADVVAQNFSLAVLSPVVSDFATELDGRVDAKVSAIFEQGAPALEGTATVRDGVINVTALGQRFQRVQARALLRDGELRIQDLAARGVSGRLRGSAVLHFRGLALRDAQAYLQIPRGNAIPLTMAGTAMGEAWGRVNLGLDVPESGETRATVDVPELHLDLPRSYSTDVQSLEPAAHVKIGMQTMDGDFVPLPLQPFEEGGNGAKRPLLVDVRLGRNVWVRRGTQAMVQLTGNASVLVAETTTVTGQIQLRGGSLDVSGKRFEIEEGTITFDGDDPSNPAIFVSARWEALDGEYRVFAEYVGRVKQGKLVLRSEPSLPPDQILSLILFGSTEGLIGAAQTRTDSSGGASLALGVAGGVATQGLNRALSDLIELDVTARIDTSTGVSRPEILVQLSPRVAASLSYVVGEPSAGQSPDRTFLSVEFRLRGNLGIWTRVGDRGASAVELIWRRRY